MVCVMMGCVDIVVPDRRQTYGQDGKFLAFHSVAGLVRLFDIQVRRATLEIKVVCCCGQRTKQRMV